MTDAGTGLDAALDRLYGLPLDQFTAARDALARELRAGGDRDASGRVKRLRKPSVAAWAVNQLARRHPDDVAGLVAAGNVLRRAQRRAVSGAGAGELREAARRQRDAVARLVDAASAVLDEAGRASPIQLDRVKTTLQAASTAPDAADLLSGRLDHDLEAAGFGELEALTLLPGEPTEDAEEQSPGQGGQGPGGGTVAPPPPPDPARRRAAEEASAAAGRLEEAEDRHERLRRAAEAAAAEAARARARADEAAAAARAAEEAAARAERAAGRAGEEAGAAARKVAEAREALARALDRLDNTSG